MRTMNSIVMAFSIALVVGNSTVMGDRPQHAADKSRDWQAQRIRAQAAIDVVHEALAQSVPPQTLRQIVLDMKENLMPPAPIDPDAQSLGIEDAEDEVETDAPMRPISKALNITLNTVREMRLPPLDVAPLREEDRLFAATGIKTRRIGVGRPLNVRIPNGQWTRVGNDGWLWSVDVVAEDAVGIRLHFSEFALPPGASLAVFSPIDQVVLGLYEDMGPFGDGEFWSPTIPGERARVEYFLPAQAITGKAGNTIHDRRDFIIDDLQHIYVDPLKDGVDDGAGNCHNDIKCFGGWPPTGKAVGRIAFVENGSSFVCSGQLINTLASDFTPYFLTAKHCIDTSVVARSAEIFWKYQTQSCDGPPPSLFSVPTSSSCTFLKAGASSDYSLLMVEGKLPQNLTWAGWTATAASNGTTLACIHHPSGDFKRISFGTKVASPECGSSSGFLRIDWTNGPTEPGSSGSGAFRTDTKQLIGILSCGTSACGNITNDSFGALSAFYNGIASFLEEGSDDWLEDNDWCSVAKAVSPGTYPELVVKKVDADWYRTWVPPGKRITVTVKFTHSWGNINLNLHKACNTTPLVSARGGGNTETVTYVNNGAGAWFRYRVNVANDPRNTYEMTVSVTDP